MMFTIENILGDKVFKRSSTTTRTESQKQDCDDERRDASPCAATGDETQTPRLRAPQRFAASPRSSRKRKSLSDGEDEDIDISGILYIIDLL